MKLINISWYYAYCRLMLFCLCCGIISSCNSSSEQKPSSNKPPLYFDLQGFFTRQIAYLDSLQPKVRKTVLLNGQKEEKAIDSIYWKEELSVFLESDINKTAWRGKYRVDTSLKEDPNIYFYVVRYYANDKDLKTQKITLNIIKDIEQIQSVYIKNVTENLLYSSTTTLMFSPDKEYTIATNQHIRFFKPQKMEIKGELVNE